MSDGKFSHSDLVRLAAKWLRGKRASVVITELVAGFGEIPDAIGWMPRCRPVLIECKASRSDFKADAGKYFRREPSAGVGQLRYFMAPKGMIRTEELPENWGLLEVGEKVWETVKPTAFPESNTTKEIEILLSCVRRIDKPRQMA